jgi:hypothetical protein
MRERARARERERERERAACYCSKACTVVKRAVEQAEVH